MKKIKHNFKNLERVLELYLKEGRMLYKKGFKDGFCRADCAGCLAVAARSNVDEVRRKKGEFGFSAFGLPAYFSSREDVCMTDARNILGKEFDLKLY